MDPLTHGILGATVAAATRCNPKQIRMAALVGGTAGMIPDLDIFIRSEVDPLVAIQFHRHFTHSILFQPLTALLACLSVWLLLQLVLRLRAQSQPLRLQALLRQYYLPALLAALTHPLNDALTSYGTHLWWPFNDTRVAWNLIAVIDPAFTLGLLAGLVLAIIKTNPRWARWGVAWAAAYVGLCIIQHNRAMGALQHHLNTHQITADRFSVKPSIGNIILWRGLYQAHGNFHVIAIRVPAFAPPRLRQGDFLPVFDTAALPATITPGSTQYRDVARFSHFSDGWVAQHPEFDDLLIDIRYSYLPWSMDALWGIRLYPSQPDRHISWETFRDLQPEIRIAFFAELLHGER